MESHGWPAKESLTGLRRERHTQNRIITGWPDHPYTDGQTTIPSWFFTYEWLQLTGSNYHTRATWPIAKVEKKPEGQKSAFVINFQAGLQQRLVTKQKTKLQVLFSLGNSRAVFCPSQNAALKQTNQGKAECSRSTQEKVAFGSPGQHRKNS